MLPRKPPGVHKDPIPVLLKAGEKATSPKPDGRKYTFNNGKHVPLNVAIKYRWSGVIHVWTGDNDVTQPKSHLYHEIVGFGCPAFDFTDLQSSIDKLCESELQICSSHIKIGWKKVQYNSRGKVVVSKDGVVLSSSHFKKFKDNLFNDLIEMGIFIYSSLVFYLFFFL